MKKGCKYEKRCKQKLSNKKFLLKAIFVVLLRPTQRHFTAFPLLGGINF